ncbi:MAG: GDSL-type esterase/lipase family protein [Oscillospiraceae bacterium]|nr:GDSL-type esterase/lipase family protein [Oscillospiraceae bacterium]MDD3832692.1 GDSL-type esterase/lipase family protein [Oscillospiraceae bacterium]
MRINEIPVNNIAFYGRTYFNKNDNALFFNWSCAGFELMFKGTKIEAEFVSTYSEDSLAAYLLVLVDYGTDNEIRHKIKLDKQKALYVLAENLSYGTHSIKVLKISECQYATAGITQIICDGELVEMPPKKRKLLIEFIGDSITCGFGNISPDEEGEFSTSTEDGFQSFAALTANNLGVDYSLVSLSGWAVYKSPYGKTVPDIYSKTDALNDPDLTEWNFQENQADIVVLGLGTNDSAWTGSEPTKLDEFESAYFNFLSEIRSRYPNAYIVCILGSLVIPEHPIMERVQNAVGRFNDDRSEFMKIAYRNKETEGLGCGHPSVIKHRKNAEVLTYRLKTIIAEL